MGDVTRINTGEHPRLPAGGNGTPRHEVPERRPLPRPARLAAAAVAVVLCAALVVPVLLAAVYASAWACLFFIAKIAAL